MMFVPVSNCQAFSYNQYYFLMVSFTSDCPCLNESVGFPTGTAVSWAYVDVGELTGVEVGESK